MMQFIISIYIYIQLKLALSVCFGLLFRSIKVKDQGLYKYKISSRRI